MKTETEHSNRPRRGSKEKRRQDILNLTAVAEQPIFRSLAERTAARERPVIDWSKAENEEIKAFVSDCLADTKTSCTEWFHFAGLFEAAYCLATRFAEDSPERRSWLDIAWDASERCRSMNPSAGCVSSFIRDHDPVDEKFARRMLDALRAQDVEEKHRAAHEFDLSCLFHAIGDIQSSRAAIEIAYRLCPGDLLIASFARRVRTAMHDYAGALEILLAQESELAQNRFAKEDTFFSASRSLQIADLQLQIGQKDEALKRLRAVWSEVSSAEANAHGSSTLLLNGCSTLLGLISFSDGDVPAAMRWLASSLIEPCRGLEWKGYDLRLAEQLMAEPSARADIVRYLEAAKGFGPTNAKAEADGLLKRVRAGVPS